MFSRLPHEPVPGGAPEVPGGGAAFAYMLRYEDEARALFDDSPNGQDEALAVDVRESTASS